MKFSKEVLKAARQIEFLPLRRIQADLLGPFESAYRGSGMEFRDFRVYEPGDDVRHISWAATAKTAKPMVKTFHEEREIEILFVVDGSSSMLSGSPSKKEVIQEMISALGIAAMRQGSSFRFVLFSKTVRYFNSFRQWEGLFHILTVLEKAGGLEQKMELDAALSWIQRKVNRRHLIFIFSDFKMERSFQVQLGGLGIRHDVFLFHLRGREDLGELGKGIYLSQDPESLKEQFFDLNSYKVRRRMEQYHLNKKAELQKLAEKTGVHYYEIDTSAAYLVRLVDILRKGPQLPLFR